MSDEQTTTDVARIDAKFKTDALVGEDAASVAAATWLQMIEVAKLMARAGIALPVHARDNPSVCWAIMMQTREWHLSNPFFVANHSYVVSNRKGDETLAYDSAVFQAVLLASKSIIGRPQYEYEGEGDEMRCKVSVQDRQTMKWESHRTPMLKRCRKNSPLWNDNPEQQLAYYGLRNLVRAKYQDVLGGFYDKDEFEKVIDEPAGPSLLKRLEERLPEAKAGANGGVAAAEEQQALGALEAEKTAAKKERMRQAWVRRKENAETKKAAEAAAVENNEVNSAQAESN